MITTITPSTPSSTPMQTTDVLVASLNKKLAIHRSIDESGYSLTHVPSGFAVRTRIVSYQDAEDLMLILEDRGNWNFRSAKSKIWTNQIDELWELVKDVQRHTY